jgi:bifunctional enzyme CysN/CysC
MGGFIVIDRHSNATLGAGMIEHSMRRSENIQWQNVDVDKEARSALAGHKPCIIWLTGLSGSGKSTIANALEKRLFAAGVRTYLLDGDNLRHGLNQDLGFTPADRDQRSERSLCESSSRQDHELHGNRCALRGASRSGPTYRHHCVND